MASKGMLLNQECLIIYYILPWHIRFNIPLMLIPLSLPELLAIVMVYLATFVITTVTPVLLSGQSLNGPLSDLNRKYKTSLYTKVKAET